MVLTPLLLPDGERRARLCWHAQCVREVGGATHATVTIEPVADNG
jgi:hypothetical protein